MPLRALTLSFALVVVAVGCGSGEPVSSPNDTSSTTGAAAAGPDLSEVEFTDLTDGTEVVVDTRDNTFSPQYIEIAAGSTVTWDNRGRTDHNVLPVDEGAFAKIDTADLEPGEQGSVTFSAPGDYAYYCSLHGTKTKGMVGAVRVLE